MVVGDCDTRNKDNYSPTSMADVLSTKTPEFEQAQTTEDLLDSSNCAELRKVSSKLFFLQIKNWKIEFDWCG